MTQTRYFLLFAVLFVSGYFLGRQFKERKNERAPIAEAHIAQPNLGSDSSVNTADKSSLRTQSKSVSEILLESSGEALFQKLYDDKIFKFTSFSDSLDLMKSRFDHKYLKSEVHKEAVARAGLLTAFQKFYFYDKLSRENRDQYVQFYKSVLFDKSQPLMVRAQAVRSLQPWISTLSHDEKSQFFAKVDSPILSIASKSKRQIAEEVMKLYE